MKIALYSHCAIDSIEIADSSYEQIGGAACYGSFTANNLKFNVRLHTKFGSDFPHEKLFDKKNITYADALSNSLTTRFKIIITGDERTLYLKNTCESIPYSDINSDGVIVSPIFDEISHDVLEQIKNNSNFVFLDPQGFLRQKNSEQKIHLGKTDLDVSKISGIKANPDELFNLTGKSEVEGMLDYKKEELNTYFILTNDKFLS